MGGDWRCVASWGILVFAWMEMGTKVVLWVPCVGGVRSNEAHKMRLRVKEAIVDVKRGQLDVFSPEPFWRAAAQAHATQTRSST